MQTGYEFRIMCGWVLLAALGRFAAFRILVSCSFKAGQGLLAVDALAE